MMLVIYCFIAFFVWCGTEQEAESTREGIVFAAFWPISFIVVGIKMLMKGINA